MESSEWVGILELYLHSKFRSFYRIAGPSQRGSMEYWQIAFDFTDGLSAASFHLQN